MASINPYVGFNGECRKAMEFYKECLGGELFFKLSDHHRWPNSVPPE